MLGAVTEAAYLVNRIRPNFLNRSTSGALSRRTNLTGRKPSAA